MISETMDYNNTLLTWKLPPKKSIDIKTMEIQQPISCQQNTMTLPPPLVTYTHHGNAIHITNLQQINAVPNQHMQANIMQHMQGRQLVCNENLNVHQQQQELLQIHVVEPVKEQNQQQPVKTKVEKQRDKTVSVKKKVKLLRKIPVDGMAYHSKQLGLKVPPKKTLGIKGMVISNQTREVIHNVYKFMKDEAQNGTKIPIANYRERVLAATGISKCTYSKITSKRFVNGVLCENMLLKARKKKFGIKLDSSQLDSAVNEDHSIYRPKINRDASTRDGVYNLDDLVPSHILAALENDASNIINLGGVDLGQSQFVSSSIQKVLTSGIPQELMIRKLTIFLYIHYLMKFMGTPMKHVTKRFVVCDRSADVNNHILDNFSVMGPNGRTRPVHMKDKSLCFIVVLAAIALDYEVDLASLSKDCKIGVKKALEISRILAFNASAKNKTVVTLKLPLPAPVTFTPKRRRK